MISTRKLILSLLAWLAVGIFWLVTTRGFHPTWPLATIATACLLIAYAAASYVNLLVLIPRYLRRGQILKYAVSLIAILLLFTAFALGALRTYYVRAIGADLVGPLGYNFGIDLFGMVVHVTGAAVVARLFATRKRST